MKTLSQKELKQRKFLVVVPALVLPFIVMIFWALGGGQNANAKNTAPTQAAGLDMHLPDPQKQEDKNSDKLSFYLQAEKDSAKLRDELRNDPNHSDSSLAGIRDTISSGESGNSIRLGNYGSFGASANSINSYPDPNEAKLNQKMAELYKQISDAQSGNTPNSPSNAQNEEEMQRMQTMMKSMNSQNTADPQMQQLSGMLDKILYIEHPELAKEKIREQSLKNKKEVFIVSTTPQDNEIQLMEGGQTPGARTDTYTYITRGKHGKYYNKKAIVSTPQNAFFDWSNTGDHLPKEANTIEAVVAETRTVVSGATMKLRLLNDIYINGILIPKDGFIYGNCSIAGDRLQINLTSIRYGNSIYPVALAVYDMDGMAGVYIPDAIGRQVAKGSADQTINGIDLYSFDNSIQGQAASAGVQAAKSLFSRKAEIIKVTVREGYKVLLKNTNEQ